MLQSPSSGVMPYLRKTLNIYGMHNLEHQLSLLKAYIPYYKLSICGTTAPYHEDISGVKAH